MAPELYAVEHIRRMRGGSQSQLLKCSDGLYYVVKFQNNPQGVKTLANELLGARLARNMGLPVPISKVVVVPEQLIRLSEGMTIECRRGREPCKAGLCFASWCAIGPHMKPVFDFVPGSVSEVQNLSDFLGMLVFDKWTCNTDGRQAVFHLGAWRGFRAMMIDQGFCFNGEQWNFPDAPRRSLYPDRGTYESVTGMNSFEPWLNRLYAGNGDVALRDAAEEIPPEWYGRDSNSMDELLGRLARRKERVQELLWAARKVSVDHFPNWIRETPEPELSRLVATA